MEVLSDLQRVAWQRKMVKQFVERKVRGRETRRKRAQGGRERKAALVVIPCDR
jgi:hypothetical protein